LDDMVLRNRLSVLWLCGEATALVTITLELLSGVKQSFTIDPAYLFLLSVIALTMPVMAFLSQILKDNANRWTNIVIGVVIAVFAAVVMLQELEIQPAIAINPAAGIVFQALIVWYAWKSKQRT
jgi:hypothetical protein